MRGTRRLPPNHSTTLYEPPAESGGRRQRSGPFSILSSKRKDGLLQPCLPCNPQARQAGHSPGHSWDNRVSAEVGRHGRRSQLPSRGPLVSGRRSVQAGGPREPAGAGWPTAASLPSSCSSLYFYPLLLSPLEAWSDLWLECGYPDRATISPSQGA